MDDKVTVGFEKIVFSQGFGMAIIIGGIGKFILLEGKNDIRRDLSETEFQLKRDMFLRLLETQSKIIKQHD